MGSRGVPVLIGALVLVLALAISCLYTVRENELALRTQFGAILGPAARPGLHAKLPWDQVVKFDRRMLGQTHSGESFLTQDSHALLLDYFVKWRIADPVRYYQSTDGSESTASDRISGSVRDGLRRVIAQRTAEQVLQAQQAGASEQMVIESRRALAPLGIELVDVQVQGLDLPEDVATRVHEGMKQTFATLAARRRAEGQSAAAGIHAAADRERTQIMSNADRDALRTRGAADAQAADIYARAYSSQPDFYAFYRSLQAYERALGKSGDVLVLTPESEFFKYLRDPGTPSRR